MMVVNLRENLLGLNSIFVVSLDYDVANIAGTA